MGVEDYHVIELVGEGSFGKVYKGRRKYTGQMTAMKFILKHGRNERDIKNLRQEIEVNKPYLPLASGDFSLTTGLTIVATSAVLSLVLGLASGSMPLLWTLSTSMLLGTAYSIDLPFLRWKRYPLLAAGCILAVRALVVQLGFFAHIQETVFGRQQSLSRPLIFATSFMCLFSIVIALFKDIPDVEGDRVFGIESFSVRLGQTRVFWFCVGTLVIAYLAAVVMGLTSSMTWAKAVTVPPNPCTFSSATFVSCAVSHPIYAPAAVFMVLSHSALVYALLHRAVKVDLASKNSIYSFYMFIWKAQLLDTSKEPYHHLDTLICRFSLFYAEYLVLPFVR
eukprot:SM000356S13439  [mRNA]  locus=s356:35883:50024:+ [translate_table: standard]